MSNTAHADQGTFRIPEWTFADRIRKARQSVEMDQKTFAANISATPSAVAQWEAGNSKPRDIVATAKRIELLTRIPAQWILGFTVGPAGIEPTTSTVKSRQSVRFTSESDNRGIVSLDDRRASRADKHLVA